MESELNMNALYVNTKVLSLLKDSKDSQDLATWITNHRAITESEMSDLINQTADSLLLTIHKQEANCKLFPILCELYKLAYVVNNYFIGSWWVISDIEFLLNKIVVNNRLSFGELYFGIVEEMESNLNLNQN